jgi:drug/metabolite transporter (DMT)-like permease
MPLAASKKHNDGNRRAVGAIQVILSAIGYGMLGVFGKRAYAAGLQSGELLALRFVLATSLLWIYVLIARRDVLRIEIKNLAACVCLGLFGYTVFSTLYFRALEGLSVALTVLLLYTYPVMVSLGAYFLFRERITRAQVLALPILACGLVMLLWSDLAIVNRVSIALAIGAAAFYAAYILVSSRILKSIDALSAGLFIVTTATAALVLLSPSSLKHVTELNRGAITSIVGLAIFSTVGPMILFLSGLEKLTSTEASLLSTIEPLTATIAAAVILNDVLSPNQIAGGALILVALVVSSLKSNSN